jgi:dolichol-phosphate mannosyltransferase
MNSNYLNNLTLSPSGSLRIPAAHSDNQNESDLIYFSLIVPTFNEGQNVRSLVSKLTNLLDDLMPGKYELIIVDDNSPDRTWETALLLMPEYPMLKVVCRTEERGLSSAVIRGWQVARGQVLGVIDGDLQHPPEILCEMLQAIRQGADLAVASRHVEGGGVSDWGFLRRILSRGAQTLGLIVLPNVVGRVSDPMSGYFLVRRNVISERDLHPMGYKILLEVIGRGAINTIAEIGYVFQERKEGASKVTWRQYVEYLNHLARLRSRGRVARLKKKLKLPITQFIRFGLVGLSGVFVDMAILYLLSDPTTLALGLTKSKLVAAEMAIINNFFWNDRWTFGDISSHQKGWKKKLKRLLKFNLICILGLTINIILLNTFFNIFGINRYIANLLAIIIVTLWNFWINLKLSWRVTQTD